MSKCSRGCERVESWFKKACVSRVLDRVGVYDQHYDCHEHQRFVMSKIMNIGNLPSEGKFVHGDGPHDDAEAKSVDGLIVCDNINQGETKQREGRRKR